MGKSHWDRIIADLCNPFDVGRAVGAIEELDRSADESWLPRLHRLLARQGNFFLREAAAPPIIRLEGLRALPRLLRALELGRKEGHDNDGLSHYITELVEMNARQAAPILLGMLTARSKRERRDAAWLLGFVRREITPEPLLSARADRDPGVRRAAVGSLAGFQGRAEVLEALIASLLDPDPGVRVDAASSLGYYGDWQAVPPLRKALKDPDETVRSFVLEALNRLDG